MAEKQLSTGFTQISTDTAKTERICLQRFSVLSLFLHAALLVILLIWSVERLKHQHQDRIIIVDLSNMEPPRQQVDSPLPKTAPVNLPVPTTAWRTAPPTLKPQPSISVATSTAAESATGVVQPEIQTRPAIAAVTVKSVPVTPASAHVPAPQTGRKADTAGISAAYMHRCRGLIERYKDYPVMARKGRIEGTAVIRGTLTRDGSLRQCNITRTSGSRLLDNAALLAVRTVERFPPVPPELHGNELVFELPVSFRLSTE